MWVRVLLNLLWCFFHFSCCCVCLPCSILTVLFFLFKSCVVSLDMLSMISCILFHCAGDVSSLTSFLIGSSSSLSLFALSIWYSLRISVQCSPVSCWIPSHLIMNFPGMSGIFGLILWIRPLGGVVLSIAVFSSCI